MVSQRIDRERPPLTIPYPLPRGICKSLQETLESLIFRFSPQSVMFFWNTQSNEKDLLRGLHHSRWDLLSPSRHSGGVFGPESKRLATGLDSGQKHAGMTARGFRMSPLRDLFQSRVRRENGLHNHWLSLRPQRALR